MQIVNIPWNQHLFNKNEEQKQRSTFLNGIFFSLYAVGTLIRYISYTVERSIKYNKEGIVYFIGYNKKWQINYTAGRVDTFPTNVEYGKVLASM